MQLQVYQWVLPQVPLLAILWGLLSVLLLEYHRGRRWRPRMLGAGSVRDYVLLNWQSARYRIQPAYRDTAKESRCIPENQDHVPSPDLLPIDLELRTEFRESRGTSASLDIATHGAIAILFSRAASQRKRNIRFTKCARRSVFRAPSIRPSSGSTESAPQIEYRKLNPIFLAGLASLAFTVRECKQHS